MIAKVHKDNQNPLDLIANLFDKVQLLPGPELIGKKLKPTVIARARSEMDAINKKIFSRKLFSVYKYKKITRSQ